MSEVKRSSRPVIMALAVAILLAGAAFWFLRTPDEKPNSPGLPQGEAVKPTSPPDAAVEPPPTATPTELAAAPRALGVAPVAAPTPVAPLPPANERSVEIVERVIGPDDAPIAGADVEARYDGAVVARTTSDAEGRVSLRVERPEGATGFGPLVVTRAAGGLAAVRGTGWSSGPFAGDAKPVTRIDLNDVKLAISSALAVRVTSASGAGVVADVAIYPEYAVQQALASIRSAADGLATFEAVPKGTYYLVASNATGRGLGWALAPRSGTPPEIVLSALRDVEVTVVEMDTRKLVVGARLTLVEQVMRASSGTTLDYRPAPVIAPTDARGATTIHGIAVGANIGVIANAPGYPGWPTSRRAHPLPPSATTLEVLLVPGRQVTWVVEAGDAPVPPDGTVLTLGASAGSGAAQAPGTGRMEAGKIVIDGVGGEAVHWLAIAPGGSRAALFALPGKTEGNPTKFVAARRVEISLHWANGTPAEGIHISLRNQGNNPMGSPVVTDAKGEAKIEDLEAQMADVYASSTPTPWGGRRIGTADLAKASAHVEATLPLRRNGTVRVFLDGVPGLPSGIASLYGMSGDVTIARQDAKAGTLEITAWPVQADGAMTIPFQAAGWLASAGAVVTAGSGAFEGRLDFKRAGALDVVVVRKAQARVSLRLEQFDTAKADWTATMYSTNSFGPNQAQLDAEGHWRLPTIAAGRYRVRDTTSSSVTDEVQVAPGDATTTVTLDVTAAGYAEGRVLVPDGESAVGIRVRVTPAPPESRLGEAGGTRCGADGTFRILIPGNREVELTADHPTLAPATSGGITRATPGAKNLEIRLVKGPTCRIQFDREPKSGQFDPRGPRSVPVYVWNGPMRGEPEATSQGTLDATSVIVGRLTPGRASFLVDLGFDAPVVLENVEVGEGETLLGPVTLSKGSALVFEVIASKGHDLPRLNVRAVRVDAKPAYIRWGEIGAKGRIDGLGRGRFHVSVTATMGGAAFYDQEIDVDGTTDVPIRIELK